MSPLVIARNQASCQNLVDSTKIERIKIESKTAHRKEKEKKERRKHKKEKHEKSKSKSHKHSSEKVADESEIEKSGLTEELEGPQKNLDGYDSDGSQNSKKRKRDDSPPAVESLVKAAPVAGKPLRIRLIFKKPKADDNSPSLPREEPLVCSTSVAESLNHSEKVGQDVVPCPIVSVPEENLPSTSALELAEKRRKHRPSKEERYNALFDDWTPSICFPSMEVDSSKNDEDDWLFGNRAHEKVNRKAAAKIDEDMSMSLDRSGDSSWPRAQFLPEVGIYSLPYTVPF